MKHIAFTIVLIAVLSSCGGTADLTCDDPQRYQQAREGARVSAPDDLDELQASKELQIPKASPREPRPEGAPCLDLPPSIQAQN